MRIQDRDRLILLAFIRKSSDIKHLMAHRTKLASKVPKACNDTVWLGSGRPAWNEVANSHPISILARQHWSPFERPLVHRS
jgi:hypothetical protein